MPSVRIHFRNLEKDKISASHLHFINKSLLQYNIPNTRYFHEEISYGSNLSKWREKENLKGHDYKLFQANNILNSDEVVFILLW